MEIKQKEIEIEESTKDVVSDEEHQKVLDLDDYYQGIFNEETHLEVLQRFRRDLSAIRKMVNVVLIRSIDKLETDIRKFEMQLYMEEESDDASLWWNRQEVKRLTAEVERLKKSKKEVKT